HMRKPMTLRSLTPAILTVVMCSGFGCSRTHDNAAASDSNAAKASGGSTAKDAGHGTTGHAGHSAGAGVVESVTNKDAGKPSMSNPNQEGAKDAGTSNGDRPIMIDAALLRPQTDAGVNEMNDLTHPEDLQIAFTPMYSGYDGVHAFKIPAVVPGLTGLKWSA